MQAQLSYHFTNLEEHGSAELLGIRLLAYEPFYQPIMPASSVMNAKGLWERSDCQKIKQGIHQNMLIYFNCIYLYSEFYLFLA
jgi:hypothetical protein